MIPKKIFDDIAARGWQSEKLGNDYRLSKNINNNQIFVFLDHKERNTYGIRYNGPTREYLARAAHFVPAEPMYRHVCTSNIIKEFYKLITHIRDYVLPPSTIVNQHYKFATNTGRTNRLNEIRRGSW